MSLPLPFLPYPQPSTAQLYEALEQTNLRLDKAWSGVKEILKRELPALLTMYNEENNRTGDNALVCPDDFYTAGSDLQDRPLPAIVVGGESELGALGMGALFTSNINACVWVVTKANANGPDIDDASVLAHLCLGVVIGFLGGYFNAAGQNLWQSLQPNAVRSIPKNEKSLYGGFFVAMEVVQGPMQGAASLYRTPIVPTPVAPMP